jgi:hypothetical protein
LQAPAAKQLCFSTDRAGREVKIQDCRMTICPIAIAVGCRKCPIFKVCPVKGLIGDMPSSSDSPAAADKPKAAARKTSATKKKS